MHYVAIAFRYEKPQDSAGGRACHVDGAESLPHRTAFGTIKPDPTPLALHFNAIEVRLRWIHAYQWIAMVAIHT